MFEKTKEVIAKKRRAISKGLAAFLAFSGATIVGGFVGGGIVSALNLSSTLAPLGILSGIVVVLPVTFLIYRFISKKFVHQTIG